MSKKNSQPAESSNVDKSEEKFKIFDEAVKSFNTDLRQGAQVFQKKINEAKAKAEALQQAAEDYVNNAKKFDRKKYDELVDKASRARDKLDPVRKDNTHKFYMLGAQLYEKIDKLLDDPETKNIAGQRYWNLLDDYHSQKTDYLGSLLDNYMDNLFGSCEIYLKSARENSEKGKGKENEKEDDKEDEKEDDKKDEMENETENETENEKAGKNGRKGKKKGGKKGKKKGRK